MRPQLHFLSPKYLWYRLSINQRASIALTIPLACVIISLGAYIGIRQNVYEAQKSLNHAHEVLLQSRSILNALLSAESAVRGYLISSQAEFLKPYYQAYAILPQSLAKLKDLVKDNPMQTQRSQTIEQLSQQKITLLSKGIPLIKGKLAPEIIRARLKLGKEIMDRFNYAVEQFEREELRLLGLRQINYDWVSNLNILVIWIGAIISILGTAVSVRLFKDLTKELRSQEIDLQESHNLIRTIVANVVDGVVVVDRRSQIESLNYAALKMFGYLDPSAKSTGAKSTSAKDANEKDFSNIDKDFWGKDLIRKDWRTLIVEDSLLITNKLSQSRGVRQDGSYFPIEVSISNIEFDDHQLLIIRDITERQKTAVQLQSRTDQLVKLNLALISANRTLAQNNQELDQFAYIVSHDLKAPLRAIANLSEWLEADLAGQLAAENQTHLQLLRSRVRRMYALLNSILEYARIGRTNVVIEPVPVRNLLLEIIDILAPPANFTIELDSQLPTLTTARVLLKQVFMNLIDNAIKFHPKPDQGKLKISVQELEQHYDFSICDNGEGIDPEFHQKVFTIFQTLEARDKRESTGVGLAIVKKIVETEGGKIQLESEVGKGATFSFTWRK